MFRIAGYGLQQRVRYCRDDLRLAGAEHRPEPVRFIQVGRITAPQLADQPLLRWVDMGHRQHAEGSVPLDHIHDAPVAEVRHYEARHLVKRRFVVQ